MVMATIRRVKSHNRSSNYRRVKNKKGGGTKSVYVKGGNVKSYLRKGR